MASTIVNTGRFFLLVSFVIYLSVTVNTFIGGADINPNINQQAQLPILHKSDDIIVGVQPKMMVSIQANKKVSISIDNVMLGITTNNFNYVNDNNFNYVNDNDYIINVKIEEITAGTEIYVIHNNPNIITGMDVFTIVTVVLIVTIIMGKFYLFFTS